MRQFFKSMFSEDTGTSHKRVLGTIGFLSLVIFLFTCKEQAKPEVISAVEFMTIAYGLGTVVEKFRKQNNTPNI